MANTKIRAVSANGLDFAYLSIGDGPLAMCLHGFPDSAHTWQHLLPQLADRGFRAVAPFQRGFAPTAVPADGCYQTGALATDANALHEALGGDADAVIIGHDFGAPAAHGAAVLAPDRWRRIVSMSVPPGGALGLSLLTNLAQLKRSWYMFFFQSPIAEAVVANADLAFIDLLWADWSPGYTAAGEVAAAKACLRQPAHLTAALGYYRAALGNGFVDPSLAGAQAATQSVPAQPMLHLHGADDGCVGAEVAELAGTMMPPNVSVEIVADVGHFLHLERPDVVNARIVDFLT